ncbi:MAG: zf-HC2 domain-containing protein [Flavobacteriales bacterium]
MPTRTPSTGPFDPRGPLSREQLVAYAEGRLAPAEQRKVEAHLENDPLLRDAVEGFQQTSATAALKDLERLRPRVPTPRVGFTRILASMLAGVFVAVTVWYFLPEKNNDTTRDTLEVNTPPTSPSTATVEAPLAAAEIAAAHELPESLHIGHASDDRNAKAMATEQAVDREQGVARMKSRMDGAKNLLDSSATLSTPTNVRANHAPRTSRQLLFLHDLKLVDPRELYGNDPRMRLTEQSTAARYADRSAQDSARGEVINVPYTAFMDEALDRFAHNDHKACLDDLRFLLVQYPDDVNALFYAGLCCYNLGLYTHARTFLHRAATHPVDVFDEEAQWYHALALEQLGEKQAAAEAFTRIAANGGFYAGKARGQASR